MRTSIPSEPVILSSVLAALLWAGAHAAAAGSTAPSFGPATFFDVGVNPMALAVGDFNGDGKLDLAVGNWGDNAADFSPTRGSVSVLLGNGDGTFQPAMDYPFSGTNVYALVVGDFNHDGKLDLALSIVRGDNYADAAVSVLLGNGDGTFQLAINSPAPTYTAFLVAGDFNGDGKLDLAMSNTGTTQAGYTDYGVSVLFGNGDGTFQAAVTYPVSSLLYSIAAGDLNGDGILDIVAVREGTPAAGWTDGGVSVLLGKGDGTFQPAVDYDAGSRPLRVVVGDFNADGKPDLGVADFGLPTDDWMDQGVRVLLGNGDGSFLTTSNVNDSAGAGPLVIGDFNGDGRPDLATVPKVVTGDVSVLLGNGDGTFQSGADFDVGSTATVGGIAVGDFNGDGNPDLAVANFLQAGFVSVLLNTFGSASPTLAIVRATSALTLSWPWPSAGFTLESTTTLNPPNWKPAPEAVVTNGTQLLVTVETPGLSRFFRLKRR